MASPCSRCGYQPTHIRARPEDDASFLTEQIHQLDETIHLLKEKKAALSRKLNVVQPSTRNLPNEILSTIFHFACAEKRSGTLLPIENMTLLEHLQHSPEHRHFSLLILGAVCSHWRRIAWSTPNLWASLVLRVNEEADTDCAIPRLYFDNAAALRMSVTLDCRVIQQCKHFATPRNGFPRSQGNEEPLESLRDLILFQHAARIKYLQLNCPPPEWLPFVSGKFAMLEEMAISWPSWDNILPLGPLSLVDAPRLQRLTLRQVAVNILLPWEQITVLDLEFVSPEIAGRLLTSCPNLVQYRASSLRNLKPDDLTSWHPPTRIALQHLKIFTWEWLFEEVNVELFDILDLPCLQELHWSDLDEYDYEIREQYLPCIYDFFSRLPASQLNLRMDCAYDEMPIGEVAEHLYQVFSRVPQLRQLSFGNGDLLEMLHLITRMMTIPRPPQQHILPDLRILSFPTMGPHVQKKNLTEALLMLVQGRWAAGLPGFRLEFSDCDTPMIWSSEIQTAMAAIVVKGFNLEILEGGHKLEWLS